MVSALALAVESKDNIIWTSGGKLQANSLQRAVITRVAIWVTLIHILISMQTREGLNGGSNKPRWEVVEATSVIATWGQASAISPRSARLKFKAVVVGVNGLRAEAQAITVEVCKALEIRVKAIGLQALPIQAQVTMISWTTKCQSRSWQEGAVLISCPTPVANMEMTTML